MTNRKFKAINILWLALALLLHSALLLVPLNKLQERPRTKESITVVLDIQSKAEPSLDQPVYQPTHNQQPEIQPASPEPQVVRQLRAEPLPAKNSSTTVTTAQLLLDVSMFKFPAKQSDRKRQLGTLEPQPLPANWIPSLKLEDNLFSSTMVSGRAKIVDQWSSADGRQNYEVKTATGKTLCGYAEPRSRIGSPEEPIIMWRLCD